MKFFNQVVFLSFFPTLALLPLMALILPGCSDLSSGAGGIYKTIDEGSSWETLKISDAKGKTIRASVLSIAIDPNDKEKIFAGTRSRGLYKSLDGGKSWFILGGTEGSSLSSRANIYSIAINSQDTRQMYVGAYQDRHGHVFRSFDGGATWKEIYLVPKEEYAVFKVVVDKKEPNIIYIGTGEGGLIKSFDWGDSWSLVKLFEDPIMDMDINPSNSAEIYISTLSKGIFKTKNKGESWENINSAFNSFGLSAKEKMKFVSFNQARPNIIYAASTFNLFKSIDGGENWRNLSVISSAKAVPINVLTAAFEQDHVYYGASNIIYKSIDGGANWMVVSLSVNGLASSIEPVVGDQDLIYAGVGQ